MLSLYDEATTKAALALPIDPDLRALLTTRIVHYVAANLASATHILVIQPNDNESDVEREIGFYPTTNIIDGVRSRSAAFDPFWDWLQDLAGWFEMIVTVGDSGFAYILLIQDADGVDPDLLAMCRAHSNPRT